MIRDGSEVDQIQRKPDPEVPENVDCSSREDLLPFSVPQHIAPETLSLPSAFHFHLLSL